MYKVCYMLDNFVVYKFFKSIDDVADFIRGRANTILEVKRVEKTVTDKEYEYND